MNGKRWHTLIAAVGVVVLVGLSGCSKDGSNDSAKAAGGGAAATTTTPADSKLRILVTNDDGVGAPGIDALVQGLAKLDNVEVTVVAPSGDRSGSGSRTTPGEVTSHDATTASGHVAVGVDGFPADSVRVAVDVRGVKPNVVVSGINAGQNLGPFVDISGTVGAARAAVARGIPALALSAGVLAHAPIDFAAAVPIANDWITTHRAALLNGSAKVSVTSVNIPTCPSGTVRGTTDATVDTAAKGGMPLSAPDCTKTTPADPAAGDIALFLAGFATVSQVPDLPADSAGATTTTGA
jgi:5'-nucleotidase